jgi:hypothetical protein
MRTAEQTAETANANRDVEAALGSIAEAAQALELAGYSHDTIADACLSAAVTLGTARHGLRGTARVFLNVAERILAEASREESAMLQ